MVNGYLKIMLAIWIATSCAGFTYSFVSERERRLLCMKEMTEGLRRLGFYINHWQLPLEEAFETLEKEGTGGLTDLYEEAAAQLKSREASDLADFWREKSHVYLLQYHLPLPVMKIWCGAFADMAPLPEEEQRRLELKAEQIEKISAELEEKYRQERKPLMAAGVSAGLIICLLIW